MGLVRALNRAYQLPLCQAASAKFAAHERVGAVLPDIDFGLGVFFALELAQTASQGDDVHQCHIGLELGISVASAALRREPTGQPSGFRSDVVATAKRDLKKAEVLDGEGGFCVWGKQTPAELSLDRDYFPLGLAQNVALKRDIREGEPLRWSDVAYDPNDIAVRVRREMAAAFGRPNV